MSTVIIPPGTGGIGKASTPTKNDGKQEKDSGMMKAVLIAGMLTLVPVSASAPSPPLLAAVDPGRLAAAHEFIDLINTETALDKMFAGLAPVFAQSVIGALQQDADAKAMVDQLLQQGKGGQPKLVAILSEEFLKSIRKQYPTVKDHAAQEYAAVFTAAELRELIAFYHTGAGAKWIALSPSLQASMTKVGREIGEIAGREAGISGFERAIKEMLPDAKAPKT